MQREDVFAEGAIERIFQGAIVSQLKASGEIEHTRISGFRYEDPDVMRVSGCSIIEGTWAEPDERGIYRARVIVKGFERKMSRSSFFPRSWTREQVLDAISEAYSTHRRVSTKEGRHRQVGESNGLKIWLWLDSYGRVVDAMPRGTVSHSPKRKTVCCNKCGKLKEKMYICNKHDLPPRWYRLMRKQVRRILYRGRPRLKA